MKERSTKAELMDLGPAYYTLDEYEDCLKQLDRVGRFLGGDKTTMKAFDKLKVRPKSILDVGCGGGSFTARLAQKYPDAKVVGLEISEQAIAFAKRGEQPSNLEFCLSDRPEFNYPDNSFDVVTASLVCHHLSDRELVDFLQRANKVARQAVIINDLHRHPIALFGFALLSPLFFYNRLVMQDGLLSIRKGFTRSDWTYLLKEAGISNFSITWHWPFRWIVRIEK